MPHRVAIQADDYGPRDASSPLWTRLLREAGHEVVPVEVRRADILQQVSGCDGFMWRFAHAPSDRAIARRLFPVLERSLGLAVYPDQATAWHFDDKIAQAWLLESAGVPVPRTWVWFDRDAAARWAREAAFPIVLKLASGAGATNVRRIESRDEALLWVERLFGPGLFDLAEAEEPVLRREARLLKSVGEGLIEGRAPSESLRARAGAELHRGYALFQEFLPGNEFDTRVTVIGRRAFAYRRFNRPGDFRASGSGNFDPDPSKIDPAAVRLALDTARRLGTQSCAMDILKRGEERVVAEVSYAYVSWMVQSCPGHWDAAEGGPMWRDGALWPEEAQIADFLARLAARRAA